METQIWFDATTVILFWFIVSVVDIKITISADLMWKNKNSMENIVTRSIFSNPHNSFHLTWAENYLSRWKINSL